ncbi:phosphoserine phosphatase SerB [Achromobacter xylosoxidans]|uniref:phosphoserine phosphatase SerB n=1 Tax=Alcaligenes xylosoxydans xylosoxydans TaxID=85698 RepID=UPI0015637390|nr:phosphoserine phosphatase SerB [Achromobacter xylosoxidans]MCH4581730.1 phosphoserine phosphatase SerB [Achromobacter xylosoxidans]QKI78179.1 phosphoserine phosphatase SerB [Achromobacter xylosoxidans]
MQDFQSDAGLHWRGIEPPLTLSDYKVIAFDMDSTLIAIETLDEMADLMGKKAEVAALTEAAMQGEIVDYKQSLRQRVALLAGMPAAALDEVYEHRLALNPGVETLIAACKAAGLFCLLVTGGFTCFTDRLRVRLGLDDVRANVLEIVDGRLTGRLLPQAWGDLCDGEEKRRKLLEVCAALGVGPERAIAVGDGANDLPMLRTAGLSVAYHAKPAVRREARVVIDQGGLDQLLRLFSAGKAQARR